LISTAIFNYWVQWLSDHVLVITFAFAAFALALEGLARYAGHGIVSRTHKHAVPDLTQATHSNQRWANAWFTNLLLFAATLVVSWSITPWVSPLLSTLLSERTGLLSILDLPYAAHVFAGFVLLDLTAFALHVISHKLGWLWRLHQVHHSDATMTASTYFRQHPLLVIVVLAAQMPLVWALSIPAASWVLYALVGMLVQLWHHSHASTPDWVERALGWLLVTPRFHRLHHHPDRAVHDHNYGAVFSLWDRLLRTHRPSAQPGTTTLSPTGLGYWSVKDSLSIFACLKAPFSTVPTRARDITSNTASLASQTPRTQRHSKARTIQHRKSS
jgi:sterol desaturase/sphingolipid hydroxylase (fatty acid hydroxylase superfamily)